MKTIIKVKSETTGRIRTVIFENMFIENIEIGATITIDYYTYTIISILHA